jgi:hypothetical protein
MFKVLIGLFLYFSLNYDSYSQDKTSNNIQYAIKNNQVHVLIKNPQINDIAVEVKNSKHSIMLNCSKVSENEFDCHQPMLLSKKDSIILYSIKTDNTYDIMPLNI